MLYFFPGAKSLAAARAAHGWLSDLCPSAQSRETMRGPGDASGLIVAAGHVEATELRYDPGTQVWTRRFGSDAWMGLTRNRTYRPTEFARETHVRGESLILLDGNAWTIPRLVAYDPDQLEGPFVYGCLLDRTLAQDLDTGRLVPGDVTPQYREVWEAALAIGDNLLAQITGGQNKAELPADIEERFIAQLLGLNYRVDTPEISALGLLSSSLARRIIRIGIDWDTLETNLKNRLSRRVSGGTNTESGELPQTEDSAIPTDPPSPS